MLVVRGGKRGCGCDRASCVHGERLLAQPERRSEVRRRLLRDRHGARVRNTDGRRPASKRPDCRSPPFLLLFSFFIATSGAVRRGRVHQKKIVCAHFHDLCTLCIRPHPTAHPTELYDYSNSNHIFVLQSIVRSPRRQLALLQVVTSPHFSSADRTAPHAPHTGGPQAGLDPRYRAVNHGH